MASSVTETETCFFKWVVYICELGVAYEKTNMRFPLDSLKPGVLHFYMTAIFKIYIYLYICITYIVYSI